MSIPKRKLGKTGVDVTILGLGGEGVLRTYGREKEAYALINAAIDIGINYFESARAYSGSEAYYGLALKERRKEIFLNSKSHARDKKSALKHLRETLSNMNTDYLDLWQIHDVRTKEEIEAIFGPNGALEAFVEAKEKGLTRFIGVTGHHDPDIIRTCLEQFNFDTVLIPVNPAEPSYRSFIDSVIPVAAEKKTGVVAMKVYFRGFASRIANSAGIRSFFRFAASHPVATCVIGCDTVEQLRENAGFAAAFQPMTKKETTDLAGSISPFARRLMYYKP
jgi:aryl-alcohol dehydrogenase-like predicted oxidoreductase